MATGGAEWYPHPAYDYERSEVCDYGKRCNDQDA